MQTHSLRLTPEKDLRISLSTFAIHHNLQAGLILTAIGSLSQAFLRYADQPEPTELAGPLELLSLQGTLSVHGLHLHAMVADAFGQVYGGHLMDGCQIRTTAEIVIGCLDTVIFQRSPDLQTGFRELLVLPQEKAAE